MSELGGFDAAKKTRRRRLILLGLLVLLLALGLWARHQAQLAAAKKAAEQAELEQPPPAEETFGAPWEEPVPEPKPGGGKLGLKVPAALMVREGVIGLKAQNTGDVEEVVEAKAPDGSVLYRSSRPLKPGEVVRAPVKVPDGAEHVLVEARAAGVEGRVGMQIKVALNKIPESQS